MKYSVCLDALYSGKNFVEAMKSIKAVGYDAFEFWCWWEKDLDEILRVKEELGMTVSTFCTKFVSLTDSSLRKDYIKGLRETIEAAVKLDCKILISQVGDELPNITRLQQHSSLVDGLKECVPILEASDITLVFEPLNTLVDHKGYYLYSSEEAFEICDEVGSKKVKVLYDIYHQQIMEGNQIGKITKNIDKIGHFHSAGIPGRRELNTGELNYENIIKAIGNTSYNKYFGIEYFPLRNPIEGLKEILKWGIDID